MHRGGKGKMCVKNRFFYDHILRLNMEEHSHVNNPESRPRPFPNLSRTITRYSHPDLPWAAASRGDPDAPPPPPHTTRVSLHVLACSTREMLLRGVLQRGTEDNKTNQFSGHLETFLCVLTRCYMRVLRQSARNICMLLALVECAWLNYVFCWRVFTA